AAPTVLIEGVEPVPDAVDPTARPAVELFSAAGSRVRLAIAYEGTLAPGQTLRLRPAHSSWLAGSGLGVATTRPTDVSAADPTAPGPWQAVAGGPPERVVALLQTRDRALWAAVGEEDAAGTLWRLDGGAWAEVLDGLPAIHCLDEDGDDLLLGTAEGLRR